jgi:tetratricopeptide (TPR) repeat protein
MEDLRRQGRSHERSELLQKTLLEYPDLGWLYVAGVRRKEGQLDEAEKAARKALQHNPASVEGHFELGTILLGQKKYAEAAESFRRVTEREPQHGAAYRALAACALGTGARQEAVGQLRQALLYLPHDADMHRELGLLLLEQGHRDEAVAHWRSALRLKPDDRQTQELLQKHQDGQKKGLP